MRWILLSLLTMAALATAGCSQTGTAAAPQAPASPSAAPSAAAQFPVTVTDDVDRQVTIKSTPRRIVSISASNTEILYALGLEDSIVGVDQYSNYPPTVEGKPRVGGYARPDLEKIVALEPDLIVTTGIHVKVTLPELDQRGLTVMVVDPRDVRGVLDKVKLLGTATGRQKEADTLVGEMNARLEAVQIAVRDVKPVRVFYELSPQLHTAGSSSFVDDLIRLAGGANIAVDTAKEWPQLNQEVIFVADPEVIFLADHSAGETPEKVAARPGWLQISAVKNNRVVALHPDLTNRPGPRVIDGLETMARALHPDRMAQGSGR